MKSNRILFLTGAMAAVQFVLISAALAAEVIPDAKVLGTAEAIFNYCARIDPAGADAFQSRSRMVAQGASDEAVQKVRKSDEYREARDTTEASLADVDPADAVKICAQNRPQGQ